MTKEEQKQAFVRAFCDPMSPTFQNATQSYAAAVPGVSAESARRAAIRWMKDEQVQQFIRAFREESKTFGALTLGEFVKFGWETLAELRVLMKLDPKYAAAIPNLFDRVGRAMGFMVQRVEDVTPPERRGLPPTGSPEYIASAREALDRMERINTPNPMPKVLSAVLVEEAEEIGDAEVVADGEDGPDVTFG